MNLLKQIQDFYHFLKSPIYPINKQSLTALVFFKLVIALSVVLFILIAVLSLSISMGLQSANLMPHLQNKLPHFLMVILIVPINEELIYRLPLVCKREFILLSIGLFSLSFSKWVLGDFLYASLITSAILCVLIPLFYLDVFQFKSKIEACQIKYFKQIFYFYALAFALIHLSNYTFTSNLHYLICPLLIIPQFITALTLGYVRLKYELGILITISVHILINLTGFLLI